MKEFDLRIVRIDVEVNGAVKSYQGTPLTPFMITASGTKYANALQNDCQITMANLDKQTQDYILTQTSPFNLNATPKTVRVFAGRESYGVTKVYEGNVISSLVSQPPDTIITLKCLTGNFQKGNIIARGQPGSVPLSVISKQVAQDLNTSLNFQASDKNLSNFSFTGAALKQVDHLSFSGGVNVFIDDNALIVKNMGVPLNNTLTEVNINTGMIGVPEFTEQGIKVKFLLNNQTKLGGLLRVTSQINPAVNGDYVTYKLGFEIASRDTPFYWIAEAARRR